MRRSNARKGLWLATLAATVWVAGPGSEGADSESSGPALTLFFIGNRMSEIEPCGCKENQLGGVQFEATLYAEVPAARSLRVDAGAWTSLALNPERSMRTRYALRAMGGLLDLDAVNVGQPDLEQGPDFFEDVGAKHPEAIARLVSANIYLKAEPGRLAFPAWRMVEKTIDGEQPLRVAIAGTAAPLDKTSKAAQFRTRRFEADYVIGSAADALNEILPEMKAGADLTVALFHGTWPETVELARAVPGLDLLVSTSRPPTVETGPILEGGVRILSVHNAEGKELGRAELRRGADGWTVVGQPVWLPISPQRLVADVAALQLLKEFRANTEELIVQAPRNPTRTYAGAQYCGICHVREYQDWVKTPHFHALDTLIAKGSQYDAKCLQCHTLGFQKDNGFYNVNESRSMGGVQCETCHGPGYEHAAKQNLVRNGSVNAMNPEDRARFLADLKRLNPPSRVEAGTCLQCHTPENDAHFDYDLKIRKVNHEISPPG